MVELISGEEEYASCSDLDWAEYQFATIEYDFRIHPEAAKAIRSIFQTYLSKPRDQAGPGTGQIQMGSAYYKLRNPGPVRSWQWLSTACQLAGAFTIALKLPFSAFAFPIMLFGTVLWAIIAWMNRDRSGLILSFGYSIINAIGMFSWIP